MDSEITNIKMFTESFVQNIITESMVIASTQGFSSRNRSSTAEDSTEWCDDDVISVSSVSGISSVSSCSDDQREEQKFKIWEIKEIKKFNVTVLMPADPSTEPTRPVKRRTHPFEKFRKHPAKELTEEEIREQNMKIEEEFAKLEIERERNGFGRDCGDDIFKKDSESNLLFDLQHGIEMIDIQTQNAANEAIERATIDLT